MTTPVVSTHPAITGALTHALADLDAVRAGRVGASDEALLDAIVLIRTLQRAGGWHLERAVGRR